MGGPEKPCRRTYSVPCIDVRQVNRRSGKVLNVSGADAAYDGKIVQWASSRATNRRQWRFLPNADGSFRLAARHSGRVLESSGGSGRAPS
ncbi:RICIN domain-containing protein [Streptomyces sp. NPDC020802]|uniref:RICIN domain-containing protein n=1 Tax=Streptomyces sp. NPDC020802 TaxID=3365094 RepID=UPI00378D361A